MTPAKKSALLQKMRALVATFPGVVEKPSHGAPSFFVGEKKCFASITDNHHGDGRYKLWVCAPPGAQAMLIESKPEHYFYPKYVGHRGWVGVYIDVAPWRSIASALEQGYLARGGSFSQRPSRPAPSVRRR
ncbi:MAG: MmcQ/YjbR family DNA-binding protein [Myxococcales bacterium]|nr:MmcQ/YjbR family DNA-binding protein [Myxococcales bacterium]